MTHLHISRTPGLAPFAAALALALAAPAVAQDTVILRPGSTAGPITPGTSQVPPISGGQIAKPALPGEPLIVVPGKPLQLPPVAGTDAAPAKPALPIPAPRATPALPAGSSIKRIDVPPVVVGNQSGASTTVMQPPSNQTPIKQDSYRRLIDLAPLKRLPVPTIDTPVNGISTAIAVDAMGEPAVDVMTPVAPRVPDQDVIEPGTMSGGIEVPVVVQPGTAFDAVATGVANDVAGPGTVVDTVGRALTSSPRSEPMRGAPPVVPRPDDKLTFTPKVTMHIFYATPIDAKASERSRVEGSLGTVSTYIHQRNADRLANGAAVQDCPAQAAPEAANAPAVPKAPARQGQVDGEVFDRDALCTRSRGGWLSGIKARTAPTPEPPDAEPEPSPDAEAEREARRQAVAYWESTVRWDLHVRDKAQERLRKAEQETAKARLEADNAEAEFERIENLLIDWDPKKADWLIEGESDFIDRLDAPDGKKQPGGTVRRAKVASRRKTMTETARDLGRAKENRDRARARASAIEREERAAAAKVDEANRAFERSAGNLDRARAGDASAYPPSPQGPIMGVNPAGQ